MMPGMDEGALVPVDHDAISENVRRFCAERYQELERSLRPLVDGSFGEVIPGHLSGYLNLLRDLGRLYQVQARPAHLADMIPAAKVQMILAAQEATWAQRLDEAVTAAKESVRLELADGQQMSIRAAQAAVAGRLKELESRRNGG